MKKKRAMAIIGVMVLAAGVLYSLPYVRIYQILSALQDRDRERLVQYVDFPQVREALKDQVRGALSTSRPNNDMDKIRGAITAQVLDKAVDQLIEPEGLSAFFSKNLAGLTGDSGNGQGTTMKIFLIFLREGHFTYASSSEFAVTLKDHKEQSIRFLLRRTGLDWRLSRINLSVPDGRHMK